MPKRHQIDVVIDPKTGEFDADVVCGPGGTACESMLDELLDIAPSSTEKKPEYFQKRVTVGKNKVRR